MGHTEALMATAGARADAIYIGRGSKWAIRFRVGVDGDRATVIAKYERWLRSQDHLLRARDELRDRDLLCFCAAAACHGDLLLRSLIAGITFRER
jgi:Domain of unknown function (DUF4326)